MYPRRCATARAMLLFPAPTGPSIATATVPELNFSTPDRNGWFLQKRKMTFSPLYFIAYSIITYPHINCKRFFNNFHIFFTKFADDEPARWPVENAIWRLNPPVYPSASIISPAKKSPLQSRLSIVLGDISVTFTPPRVMIASSIGRNEFMCKTMFFSVLTKVLRSVLVI